MPSNFSSLADGIIGRFAVVKLWPKIKTAEDECIARLKLAAKVIGVECVEIYADGSLISNPKEKVSKRNVDFVIHLHYDTPKQYDAFSFVALWNPIKFYHEWGYARCSRNLTTHDDFLSCGSDPADDHVRRMIRRTSTHLPPRFRLYHSTPDIIHPPSLGDGKLFYAGINWEAISGGKSRHQEVLKRLDESGLLRIYGPDIFQGVRVWSGYRSYVREIPFDGVAMIDEISKAGVALVLSSQAHRDSALMSSRLFESVAAGALVICDENPFAKTFFGDSLLYIDSRAPIEQICTDIVGHLDWAKEHPTQSLSMISKAQDIFRNKFTLTNNLGALYSGLADRKQSLKAKQNPPDSPAIRIRLHMLMPEYSEAVLRAHVNSICVQEYHDFDPVIVIDKQCSDISRRNIEAILQNCPRGIELTEIDYFKYGAKPDIKIRRPLGAVIQELFNASANADAFMVTAPNEELFSNHLAVLAGALQRDPNIHCAATAVIFQKDNAPIHSVHEVIDFRYVDRAAPVGYGRFIFRVAAVPEDIGIALPYLDGRPLAVLRGDNAIAQQLAASVIIDTQTEFPDRTWDEAAENEIIGDYTPSAFSVSTGYGPRPRTLADSVHARPSISALQLARRLLSRRWVKAQIQAVRDHGLRARFNVLKQKLTS